jgi:hypothetical protein
MGTSFVEFQNKGFWARDGSLEVWLHFLATEIDWLPTPSPWLHRLRDHWYQQAQSGAVGCLWVGLDDFVTQDAQVEEVILLCEAALRRLMSYGEVLPQDYLNSIASEGSSWSRDVEVTAFTRIGHAFKQLLRGELATDAATSPVM